MILLIGEEVLKKNEKQRILLLKNVSKKKTGNSELAELMYQAVRTGGEPYYPTWYRWGYGWPLGRGYKKLSVEELELVEKKLEDYNLSRLKKDI